MATSEEWSQRYVDGDTPWETGHPSTELRKVIDAEKPRPCRALDLGCGSGANAIWLAQQGFEVTGVDFSGKAIEIARQKAAEAQVDVQFIVADLAQPIAIGPPFPFFFDRGCYHVLRRNGQVAEYFNAIRKLTAPGSLGLLLTGNARAPESPGPPTVSEQDLRGDWEQDFEVLWLREFQFDKNLMDDSRPLAWSAWLRRK